MEKIVITRRGSSIDGKKEKVAYVMSSLENSLSDSPIQLLVFGKV